LDSHTTGDGILSALKLLEVMIETDKSLSSLAAVMQIYPQVLKNVNLPASYPDLMRNKMVVDTIQIIEDKLGDKGRVLIRYSGTQPLLRVMVEGPDQGLIDEYCVLICESIKTVLKDEL
jgi:phosphoglucosamine mutase